MTEITISAGNLRLVLAPSVGGAIASFAWSDGGQEHPVLRSTSSHLEQVLDAGCFPLVPYVNRIRGGRFAFRGRTIEIEPNMAGDPSPLHGQGWLGPWGVEQHDERSAALIFRHDAGEWPWSYEAREEAQLDEQGLSLSLVCRNMSDQPMPCGLGHHPYFPCTADTRLKTAVDCAWTIDDEVLPVDKVPADGRYDLAHRRICGQGLDNGFGGWGGTATMTDPNWPFDIVMSSPQARFFQVYSPACGGIFVAEPVSHANAALNAAETQWRELGMRVLKPGEEMRLDMRLDVTAK